jgi:Fe-S cluster assembly protein SufD
VFVNGIFVPALSDTTGLPPGIRVGGVRAMLAEAPDVLERHLGRYAEDAASPFGGLNTAFLGDGAVVHIPPEVIIERPLHVLFLTTAANGGRAVSHPRTLVVAERGSRATLVESYAALAEAEYWTNAVTEVVLGDGANVDLYRVQQESGRGHHTAATYTDQGRASRFKLVAFAFGGHLVRHDVRATLGGEGADCTLDGLTMARGSQHVDHHTTLVHAQPNCTSWEYLNGVYDDQSRGVFNGRIIVRPGAQKTDAKQTNNNLLLSDRARADSQPQLEIYADDVKCTHGATLGPIDDEHLFYLQSRGLDRAQARQLLTYGFGSEILRAVDLPALRAELDRVVRNRLGEGATRRS